MQLISVAICVRIYVAMFACWASNFVDDMIVYVYLYVIIGLWRCHTIRVAYVDGRATVGHGRVVLLSSVPIIHAIYYMCGL